VALLTRNKPAPPPAPEAPPRDAMRRFTWDHHRAIQLRDLRARAERYKHNRFTRESLERQIRAYEDPEPPDGWNVIAIDGEERAHTVRSPQDAQGRPLRRLEPHEEYPPGWGVAPGTLVGDDVVMVPA
jgi:hypothetical protein